MSMRLNTQFWDQLALESYLTLLKSAPRHALIHNNLGLVYMRLQQFEKAEASLKTAIDCDPTWAAPHYHLGEYYRREGDFAAAKEHLELHEKLYKGKGASKDSHVSDLIKTL